MAGSWNGLFPIFPENKHISFQGSSYKGPFQKLTSTHEIIFPDEIKHIGCFPKNDSLHIFTDQSQVVAKNQDGPYGP